MQLTVANNKDDVPLFARKADPIYRSPAALGAYTSYVEGWALYSESLGRKFSKIYQQDDQIFGYYSLNLLRASRLVVDTGLHAMNWTRQEAIDYLSNNTFMNLASIETEVDRYITWPGQALSYKMGERKIKETQRRLIKNDIKEGKVFNLIKFHDAVLNCNGPLNELDGCVDEFLASNISSNGLVLKSWHFNTLLVVFWINLMSK